MNEFGPAVAALACLHTTANGIAPVTCADFGIGPLDILAGLNGPSVRVVCGSGYPPAIRLCVRWFDGDNTVSAASSLELFESLRPRSMPHRL